jgi:hypothetical protein
MFCAIHLLGSSNICLEKLIFLLICGGSSNKSFISFSSTGTLVLDDCRISLADIFITWEKSGRAWGGTFILLNSGNCLFSSTEFMDIIVNDTNALISSTVNLGCSFHIENTTFIQCGCIGPGANEFGAPLNVDVSNGGYFSMINTTIKECESTQGEVQILYVKAKPYKSNFEFSDILFDYSQRPSEKMIYIEIDFCSFMNEYLHNETFRKNFNSLNKSDYGLNVYINNTSLTGLLDEISELTFDDICNTILNSICFWLLGNDSEPLIPSECAERVRIYYFGFVLKEIFFSIYIYSLF